MRVYLMETINTETLTHNHLGQLTPLHEKIDSCNQMIQDYWDTYPEMYRMVQIQKQLDKNVIPNTTENNPPKPVMTDDPKVDSLFGIL